MDDQDNIYLDVVFCPRGMVTNWEYSYHEGTTIELLTRGQAAPLVPRQLRCLHPGVHHSDELFLPSTPGTPKSGAPPLAGFNF